MTEHDLYEYRRRVADRKSILDRIAEFEGRRGSPPGVNMSPFPPDHGDPAEGFASSAEYHDALVRKLEKTTALMHAAAEKLDQVRALVEYDAILVKFVEKAYFSGLPYGKIPKVLNCGRTTVYRMRKTILAIVERI